MREEKTFKQYITKYDSEMIQQICEAIDMVEYVGNSIDLERRGKDYFGHCPLHIDKTPSFSINSDKNYYYCFSCGRGGDLLNYLQEYEHMPFKDALEKAAKLANIELSSMCKSETMIHLKKIKRLYEQKKQAQHPILNSAEIEQFSNEEITEWINEGIRPDILKLFGVRIDKKSNRIVYPVYDIDGKLINVKGRTMLKEYKLLKLPKYINYFPIGIMDYFQSLNITLPYVKEKGEIIIFESIKSVMKAYGWGHKNCASAEKHSLTDEQVKLLTKLRVDVVFAYDSDVDYYREDAVRKNIEKLKRIANVYVIFDKKGLLGGKAAKNAPVDLTKEIWEELYREKVKII